MVGDPAEKPAVVKKLDQGQGNKKVKENLFPGNWWHSGEGKAGGSYSQQTADKSFPQELDKCKKGRGTLNFSLPFFSNLTGYWSPPYSGAGKPNTR
jgi:hypothetical protein